MKFHMTAFGLLAAVSTFAGTTPQVDNVTIRQTGSRKVEIGYTLANAPAIVTVDIQTNRGDGVFVSIGGKAVRNVTGAANEVIYGDGAKKVFWYPDIQWPESGNGSIAGGNLRAAVTAWSPSAPPDYLVINLKDKTEPLRYYVSEDALPLGIESDFYRTNSLVMRKIPARGVRWRIGAANGETGYRSGEDPRWMTLTEDYYIAVFEMTGGQAIAAGAVNPSTGFPVVSSDVRPCSWVYYQNLRGVEAEISANSYLDKINKATGLDFDLPTEAQWEYACRAGCGLDHYDGSPNSATDDATLNRMGRQRGNSGRGSAAVDVLAKSLETYTARVGEYLPNAWGLYDMLGNVSEWCKDYCVLRSAPTGTEGTLVDYLETDSASAVSAQGGPARVAKGGTWSNGSWAFRAPYRDALPQKNTSEIYNTDQYSIGYRLVLPIPGK